MATRFGTLPFLCRINVCGVFNEIKTSHYPSTLDEMGESIRGNSDDAYACGGWLRLVVAIQIEV